MMFRPVAILAAILGVLAVGFLSPRGSAPAADAQSSAESGIHKIKHVVIIMQENRSFDHYFGTYPGADGIPMKNGTSTVCVPDTSGQCARPYHDTNDRDGG